jgi:nitrile hydratase
VTGPQDLGGRRGFGPIPEPGVGEREVFAADWERRVFGLSFCSWVASGVEVDQSRAWQASLPDDRYYGSSYYERWLYSLERLMVEKGVATEAEIASGSARPGKLHTRPKVEPAALAAAVAELADHGVRRFREPDGEPVYAVGDRVRVKESDSVGYDRVPTYLKGRRGRIAERLGAFGHPADLAVGRVDAPGAHCYRVRFKATELWGESAEHPGDSLCVDLFESHLEPA